MARSWNDALGCWRIFSDFDQAPRDVITLRSFCRIFCQFKKPQLPAGLEVSLCRFFPTDLKHVAVSRNAFHSSTSHQCSRSMAPEVLFWGFFICLLVVVSCVDVLACFQSFKIIGFQNPVFYWFYYLQYIFHWVGDFMILERRIHDFWDIPDIPNKIWEQAWCAARCLQMPGGLASRWPEGQVTRY